MLASLINCKQIFCGAFRKYGISCVYNILFILLLFIALCTTIKSSYEADQDEVSTQKSNDNGAVAYEMKSLKKEFGNNQNKENHYAVVDIAYPLAIGGSEACKDSINRYIQDCLIHKLSGFLPEDARRVNEIGVLAQHFLDSYKEFVTDFPDSRQRWNITIYSEVVCTTSAVTSLALSLQSYTGGAHGNSEMTYNSFNTTTGEKIRLSDIVTDGKKLVEVAEKKFRAIKKLKADDDLKKAGFWFEGNKFSLNDNYCLTGKGLAFYFNQYEIAPYAAGPTELVLTFEELDTIIVRNLLSY